MPIKCTYAHCMVNSSACSRDGSCCRVRRDSVCTAAAVLILQRRLGGVLSGWFTCMRTCGTIWYLQRLSAHTALHTGACQAVLDSLIRAAACAFCPPRLLLCVLLRAYSVAAAPRLYIVLDVTHPYPVNTTKNSIEFEKLWRGKVCNIVWNKAWRARLIQCIFNY